MLYRCCWLILNCISCPILVARSSASSAVLPSKFSLIVALQRNSHWSKCFCDSFLFLFKSKCLAIALALYFILPSNIVSQKSNITGKWASQSIVIVSWFTVHASWLVGHGPGPASAPDKLRKQKSLNQISTTQMCERITHIMKLSNARSRNGSLAKFRLGAKRIQFTMLIFRQIHPVGCRGRNRYVEGDLLI